MPFTQSWRRTSLGKGRRPGAGWREAWRAWHRDETGAVAVITALSFMVFLALLALVLDIGHLEAVRSELQNAADASALAGARALHPPAGTRLTPLIGDPSCSDATTVAANLTNKSDLNDLAISLADVQLGHWGWPGETNFSLNQFVPLGACSINVNAVRVMARRDQNLNQPVATWFARVFGVETVDVTSRAAIAALGYVGGVVAGRAFPIAINKDWLMQQLALPIPEGGIKLNPDGGDNGGWASPTDQTPSGANLKKWISDGFPEQITIDNLINLNNGTIDSAIQEVSKQLPSHTQNYTVNGQSFPGWMVLAPVVTVDKFNLTTPVDSFQAMIILDVDAKGMPKTIEVVFYDGPVLVHGGIPGGPRSNLYADLPRLVQ
jgi:hypothetical protein